MNLFVRQLQICSKIYDMKIPAQIALNCIIFQNLNFFNISNIHVAQIDTSMALTTGPKRVSTHGFLNYKRVTTGTHCLIKGNTVQC